MQRQRGLPRLWDREDLRQEAFIVFAETCAAWSGTEGFEAYFEREYGPALTRHVRRARQKQRRETTNLRVMPSPSDPYSAQLLRLAELLEALTGLPPRVGRALRLHLLRELPMIEVGRELGIGKRALGEMIPMARDLAAGRAETEDARLERLLRELYSFTDPKGRLRGTARQVRRRLGITPAEHAELLDLLEECRALTGRRPGYAGALPPDDPDGAVRLLQAYLYRRTA